MTLKAVLLTTPHEKSITLHRTIEEAEKAVHDFLIRTYAQTQHSSDEGLGLDDLLEYFDGEIEYEIFETSL